MKTKIIVISNHLLDDNNNNGKVLKNYLSAFEASEICQFYIAKEKNDLVPFDTLRITDNDIVGYALKKKQNNTFENQKKKLSNKPMHHLLRYWLWSLSIRAKKQIKKFVNAENPTHICVYYGDTPHMHKIALRIAKTKGCKMIVFCGEDYPLKEHNYLQPGCKKNVFFRIFISILRRTTKKLFKCSDLIVFNSPALEEAYKKKYHFKKSLVCFQASSLTSCDKISNKKCFLYGGNLGLGRDDAIVDVSKKLFEIDPSFTIDVYGNATQQTIEKFSACKNIIYYGLVSNKELLEKFSDAFAILHVEKNTRYNVEDLKYAFSTKLSDIIVSQKRFLLYAPVELLETQYMKSVCDDYVAVSFNDLDSTIKNVLFKKKSSFPENVVNKHESKKVALMVKKEICEI